MGMEARWDGGATTGPLSARTLPCYRLAGGHLDGLYRQAARARYRARHLPVVRACAPPGMPSARTVGAATWLCRCGRCDLAVPPGSPADSPSSCAPRHLARTQGQHRGRGVHAGAAQVGGHQGAGARHAPDELRVCHRLRRRRRGCPFQHGAQAASTCRVSADVSSVEPRERRSPGCAASDMRVLPVASLLKPPALTAPLLSSTLSPPPSRPTSATMRCCSGTTRLWWRWRTSGEGRGESGSRCQLTAAGVEVGDWRRSSTRILSRQQ